MTAQKTFDLGSGESTTLYFRAYPRYDAGAVVFDNANSGSTSTEITLAVDRDDFDSVDGTDINNMETQFASTTVDPSSVDGLTIDPISRTIAVKINETGNTNGVEGRVELHSATDEAENVDAFYTRLDVN